MFRIPKLQHHKASGQGRVLYDGKHHYFGRFGSEKCEAEYRRFCAELSANRLSAGRVSEVTVEEVLASAWEHIEVYYVKDGRPTSEQQLFKRAFSFVRELYAETPAKDFGPVALKAVREGIINAGFTRKSVNKAVSRIRYAFRLAVENEMIDGNVLHRLQAVRGLKAGRCNVSDRPPVRPVSDDDILTTVFGFQQNFTLPIATLDAEPCAPNGVVSMADIFTVVLAFQGVDYTPGCALPCP